MTKIGANPTKYLFDNYYKLIRTYFTNFSKYNALMCKSEIYIIRNNTVYTTMEHITLISGYFRIQLQGTHGSYLLKVCECDLIEIRMIYSALKRKYGKVVTILN
jgi:hypothetical protein